MTRAISSIGRRKTSFLNSLSLIHEVDLELCRYCWKCNKESGKLYHLVNYHLQHNVFHYCNLFVERFNIKTLRNSSKIKN